MNLETEPHKAAALIAVQDGDLAEAAVCLRRVLEIDARDAATHSQLIGLMAYLPQASLDDQLAERRRWQDAHGAPILCRGVEPTQTRDPDRPLRIGYVSADFREHSAVCAFGPMILGTDPERFEVYLYPNSNIEQPITRSLRYEGHRRPWRNITHIPDDQAVDLVRADRIDILVDLSGHSQGNRLGLFARKPAPIQVSAWGFATSTGLESMDYLFTDEVALPPEEKEHYVEEVRYLPSVAPYWNFRGSWPHIRHLPGLERGYITFGAFHQAIKINEQVVDLWTAVLKAVPDSRLFLKVPEMDLPPRRERILAGLGERGIERGRILWLGRTSWLQHVDTLNQVDIMLDTFPHSGGMTTVESLMMGVPVVTLRWPTIAGRGSASFLTTVALRDWIAETPEQYVEMAVCKAADLRSLEVLRQDLRGMVLRSMIGDTARYVKRVEEEYRTLWKKWCDDA